MNTKHYIKPFGKDWAVYHKAEDGKTDVPDIYLSSEEEARAYCAKLNDEN